MINRAQFPFHTIVGGCIMFIACGLWGWSLYRASRWLQEAYEVQDWLWAHHLGAINVEAEIIGVVGPIPTMAAGGIAGAVLAIIIHCTNLALQRTPDSRSSANPEPGGPAPLS